MYWLLLLLSLLTSKANVQKYVNAGTLPSLLQPKTDPSALPAIAAKQDFNFVAKKPWGQHRKMPKWWIHLTKAFLATFKNIKLFSLLIVGWHLLLLTFPVGRYVGLLQYGVCVCGGVCAGAHVNHAHVGTSAYLSAYH